MSTSLFEKIILFVLAGLVSLLVWLSQGVSEIHDDLLILKQESSYTTKQLILREQKMRDFDVILKSHGEKILKLEWELKQ